MTNNSNDIKGTKFDTSDNPGPLSYATTVILKFNLNESELNKTLTRAIHAAIIS